MSVCLFFFNEIIVLSRDENCRLVSRRAYRSSQPKLFLGKGVLKICSKFTREHSCRSAISIKVQSNFNEITLWHGCSPVNLLHIFFRRAFLKIASRRLLLSLFSKSTQFDIQYNLYGCKKHHLDLLVICHIHKAYQYRNFT